MISINSPKNIKAKKLFSFKKLQYIDYKIWSFLKSLKQIKKKKNKFKKICVLKHKVTYIYTFNLSFFMS